MTDTAPNQSARILGQPQGLTAVETNLLLKQQGFLEGEAGAYRVTPKGEPFATEKLEFRGTGGYPSYNPTWSERTWNPRIVRELDLSDAAKRQARGTARVERAQRAAERAARAVPPSPTAQDSASSGAGPTALPAAAAAAVVVAAAYGARKAYSHLKTRRAARAARAASAPEGSPGAGAESRPDDFPNS